MHRLIRLPALGQLSIALGTFALLGGAIVWLRHVDSLRAPQSSSDTSAASATALEPLQPDESPGYPRDLIEPRPLNWSGQVAPVMFEFGAPPLPGAGGSIAVTPPVAVAPPNAAPNLPVAPLVVEPAAPSPWYSSEPAPSAGAPPSTGPGGPELGGPQINPPGVTPVEPAAEAVSQPSVLRRLPPAEDVEAIGPIQPREESPEPGVPQAGLPEPWRMPAVDEQPESATTTRLPPADDATFRLPPTGADASEPAAVVPQGESRDALTVQPESAPRLRRLPSDDAGPDFEPTPPLHSLGQSAPTADLAPPRQPRGPDPALAAVSRQAMERVQYGFSLGDRGATFSARAQFIQALRLIAQALDASESTSLHSESLARGLRALEEADDFVPRGSLLEADMDVASIVASHRTPAIKDEMSDGPPTPLIALQRYYTYAQHQLAAAGGGMPAASMALYALGKIHTATPQQAPHERRLTDPKALALHHAALLVDSRNYEAANELGVLLVRYGQLQDARGVLLHGLSMRATAPMWHNLAVVHERLGEIDLARRARHEEQIALGQSPSHPLAAAVQWVPAAEFVRNSPVDPSLGNTAAKR